MKTIMVQLMLLIAETAGQLVVLQVYSKQAIINSVYMHYINNNSSDFRG
jgi:hypothetical protein